MTIHNKNEPRLLTHMSKDPNLIDTYNNKKDLYATIGSFVFHKDYWECMEHWEDGSPNPVGKEIRKKCKGLVLGIMYGMGAKLMASILGVSIEECKSILEEFYKMFPSIKEFTQKNEESAKEVGYVEDYMGRRRHLPDASLNSLDFSAKKTIITNIDQLLDCSLANCEIEIDDKVLSEEWLKKWEIEEKKPHRKSAFDVKNDNLSHTSFMLYTGHSPNNSSCTGTNSLKPSILISSSLNILTMAFFVRDAAEPCTLAFVH